MGRYYWDKKDTVEDCRSVSISFLTKHDYLSENSCRSGGIAWKNCYGEETSSIGIVVSTFEGEKYVRFYYTVTDRSSGQKTDYDYKVNLTTTPCNFGGVRYWFILPSGYEWGLLWQEGCKALSCAWCELFRLSALL